MSTPAKYQVINVNTGTVKATYFSPVAAVRKASQLDWAHGGHYFVVRPERTQQP